MKKQKLKYFHINMLYFTFLHCLDIKEVIRNYNVEVVKYFYET